MGTLSDCAKEIQGSRLTHLSLSLLSIRQEDQFQKRCKAHIRAAMPAAQLSCAE